MTMIDLSRRDLFTIGGALGVASAAAHAEMRPPVSKPTTPPVP